MKTLSSLIILVLISASSFAQQGKNTVKNNNGKNNSGSTRTNTSETTPYNSRIFNSCTQEWITLTGEVTYSIKEMKSDDRYFIMYDINLSKITGVGDKSGAVYKGGGHIKDKVIASYKNNHVVGNNKYNVKYKAANTSITVTQHAHYVSSKDDTKVTFNDEVESCE